MPEHPSPRSIPSIPREPGAEEDRARARTEELERTVDELTRAEQALRESEAKYRELFQHMTSGFTLCRVIFDGDRPVDYVHEEANLAFETQTGLSRDAVLGRRITEVLPGLREDPAGWIELLGNVARTGAPVHYERHFADLDRWYEATAYRPKPGYFAVFFSDVTERKRTEERLRESTTLLRAISDTSGDVIFAKDRDGRMRFANPGAVALVGKPAAELLGKTDLEFLADPAVARQIMETDGRIMATGAPAEVEEHVPDSEGRPRVWLSRKTPYRDADGNVIGLLGISRDITERKRVGDALREANDRLREADRRKDEFISVLSHELRNPLAPILSSIQLLARAAPDSPQAARAREVIHRQTEHLTRLVDDLLDVTRVTRGKIQLQPRRLDLRDVARRTCDDHRAIFDARGIALHLDTVPGAIWVDGDPTRLSQIVGNLLQNAAKFTPEGGTVTVHTGVARGQAELRVRDDGVGMEAGELERMFEPFAQAERSLARTRGGLGLGLALVRGLAELHGGTAHARSEGPGRGAELVVTLPLAPTPEAEAGPARERDAPTGRSVLIVEDNLDAGQSLADLLELSGHRVALARDGRTGIALAGELRPDVVLCDIGLPDMSGFDVARALRADERLRRTRLVALSGYAQREDLEKAREAGFDAHLPKPPPLERLEALLGAS
ncbi:MULTISPECIES: PAS domain-containing protein [unclassified Anaeromyxobacter]|uniref:PAS domain-containing protein n=1 Tax=unclassified Anaeromyxobacter TaxID=2620896 RepID=UPI001F590C70|nr:MULTISPECIES: PAS domain-containing protein [unclassified Anaeromyxobacter]